MENSYVKWGISMRPGGRAWRTRCRALLLALSALIVAAAPARGQDQLMFPATQDAQQVLLQKIRAEQVRPGGVEAEVGVGHQADRREDGELGAEERPDPPEPGLPAAAGVRVRAIYAKIALSTRP